MGRLRHPDKDIDRAVQYAVSLGWEIRKSPRGHAWGHLYCPQHTREGCKVGVYSTPRNAGNHAQHIQREIDSCPHGNNDPTLIETEEDDGNQDIV
jgi:hypothetical protein